MDATKKFLFDYFKYKLSTIVAGRKNYEEWRSQNLSLKKVKIKNRELADEIAQACKTSGGFLTYAEFLAIDQFGKNGYHTSHKEHGITITHKHWGKAIAGLCEDKKLSHVLEFGPGAGDLGIEIMKYAKKKNLKLSWNGIELNPDLRNAIKNQFKKKGFENNLSEVASTLQELKTQKRSLVVFSYSLDSIPPEIFINTTQQKSFPNTILGVVMEDGYLKEVILTNDQLKMGDITLENGIFQKKHDPKFDLTSWKLFPGQRAYICISSFLTFANFADVFPNSTFLIIDEFQGAPYPWETRHLGIPKDLHRFKREIEDIDEGYREAGNNLLYFQIYFLTFYKFLTSLGFRKIQYEIEQKMARDITSDHFFSVKEFLTYAFIAEDRAKMQNKILPLEFPKGRII